MKLQFFKTKLQLIETFSIAYGNYDFRNALVVSLSHSSETGYGECVEINYYGIHLEEFITKLQELQPEIEKFAIEHPNRFYDFLDQKKIHPFLKSALDCAYWDLFGKLEKKSFIEFNQIPTDILPESSLTISIAPIEEQILKIQASSWSNFKVKCKHFNPQAMQQLLTSGKKIALDANTSFKEEDCVRLQKASQSKDLLYVEQPMPIGAYHELSTQGFVNWMADEDAQSIEMLPKLQAHYKSINIKLMKCGGLTPGLQMIYEAKRLGFKVMLGCMTESSIGISAACALGGLLDFADLDGANLISNDYAVGSEIVQGKILLSTSNGLGIRLKEK